MSVPDSLPLPVATDRHSPNVPLRYPGTDDHGKLWEKPPPHPPETERLPEGRPPFIAVLGSSGFKEIGDPIRLDLASGGTIPGLALAAGINREWRRIANAGVPSHKILRPADGLRWYERKNLDLAGMYDMSAVETWLADWLKWAGVETFRDLRYRPGDIKPPTVEHRAGICVSIWRTKQPYPARCTKEELRDPAFIHKAFRWAFFGRQFPFKQFEQMWVPDTVGRHLPWLADEIDDHSPAYWAKVSMSQWPAAIPTLLQDPRTRQLIILGDGGHIDNQPSLFNDGHRPPFPLLNPRLQQNRRQRGIRQIHRDARRMPFGAVLRFKVTPETKMSSLQGHSLTWQERDAMWRRGVEQGREFLPAALTDLLRTFEDSGSRNGHTPVEVPGLHLFQLIAARRRQHTAGRWGIRS
ncbi:MAG: hypothetical protein HOQ05_13905 [Corynebacteriales bacterium]|nr:hypothetical protein [Mycobacteriales bacterium]